jgi:hypothetical protein
VFIKAGSIIPTVPLTPGAMVGLAGRQFAALEWTVYPGASAGAFDVYEDDGISYAYLNGSFAFVKASYIATDSGLRFDVVESGSFAAKPTSRTHTLKLESTLPPSFVAADNVRLPWSRWGGAGTWSYDGLSLTTIINMPEGATSVELALPTANGTLLSGLKGRLQKAIWAKRNLDEARSTPGENTAPHGQPPVAGFLSVAASTADQLSYLAGKGLDQFMGTLTNFTAVYTDALQQLKGLQAQAAPGSHAVSRYDYSIRLLESAL